MSSFRCGDVRCVVRGQKREEKRDQRVLLSFVGVGRHLVVTRGTSPCSLYTMCDYSELILIHLCLLYSSFIFFTPMFVLLNRV